jgi:histidinol-phosphate aminotransferase
MLIGLRTFSKFYGLAGLRIGYAFGTPAAMRLFERLEHLFCVSQLAQEAALAALADTEHALATHALLRTEKERIRKVLAAAGLATVPSEAHFLLVQCPVPAADAGRVWDAFAEAGIIIPHGVMFDRYMMVPVLRPEQNDRHLAILTSLCR